MRFPLPSPTLGRMHDVLPPFLRAIQFRPVQNPEEFTAASHLVYREYALRQYAAPTSSQLKLSIYHALPQTTTFIATHHRIGVIATICLIEDSPLGLPMDDAYKPELDAKRRKGLRLAEATMLAIDGRLFSHGVFSMTHTKKLLLLMRILKVMLNYARSSTAVDEIVTCFHPKHQLLFEYLDLKEMGGLKSFPGTNGTPTVARSLNLEDAKMQAVEHPAYRFFLGRAPSAKPFMKKLAFTPEDLRRLFVLDTSIFASASPTELAYLMSCYSRYNFAKIVEGSLPSSALSGQDAPVSNKPPVE